MSADVKPESEIADRAASTVNDNSDRPNRLPITERPTPEITADFSNLLTGTVIHRHIGLEKRKSHPATVFEYHGDGHADPNISRITIHDAGGELESVLFHEFYDG